MNPQSLINEHFGGKQSALAAALGVTRASVSLWVKAGKFPFLREYQIREVLSSQAPVTPSGDSAPS